MPNTRQNGHDTSTATRSRSRRRSHTLSAEANRHVIQPARRIVRKGTRRMKRQISTLPSWVPWAAAGVGLAAAIYAVSRMEAVQDFVSDISDTISDTIGDTFGDSDYIDEGDDAEYGSASDSSDYPSSDYGNADYGSNGAGGI